ncbi:hypothetical protein SAMN05661080_00126 [Modestobacter sp. DSM 44400]|uniref:hypothetical protein n=1 Tax=Modestobacter sp. DSM 44400 TaxID=1550230 RepID=UPI00089BAFD9|nr:hypothetical protein [Modestobacter sp. DSM 44400]SDX48677.1 hypothetical protein SAMN05661080_00126 [Modestobacter sp. DSM 44400]
MSFVRWTTTCLVMAATAWLLGALGPTAGQVRAAATAPQALVDTAGPDALLVVAAATAGWLCWGWGVLGLALTGLSALPGVGGRAAGLVLLVVLPASARRAAAVAVGLSLAAGAPTWACTAPSGTAPSGTAAVTALFPAGVGGLAPASLETDWPVAEPFERGAGPGQRPAEPPDWPPAPPAPPGSNDPAAEHVVLRGDCLWDIARRRPGPAATGDAGRRRRDRHRSARLVAGQRRRHRPRPGPATAGPSAPGAAVNCAVPRPSDPVHVPGETP